MELKNKVKQIILRVICGIFLITAIFFGVVSACYSVSGGTPNIFGTYVYLVKTDAFDLLKNGTALVAKEVHASEIQPWNIVIFELENGEPALAEIRSGQLYDGVYSFEAATENGAIITLSQSQIVAMGTSYSDIWGKILNFAVSPLGVLLVAVVPSLIIIIIEFSKFINKTMPQPEIETVKKQLEVPTYMPESGRAGAMNAYKTAKNSSLDDSIGFYDVPVKQSSGIERGMERTDVLEIPAQETPLFLGPKRKPVAVQKRSAQEQMPLSQKKLNDAIAAARAEREMGIEREKTVKDIQKNRGAAIAAEKREYEEYLKSMRADAAKNEPAPVKPPVEAAPEQVEKPRKPEPASKEKKQDTSKIQKPAQRKEKEFTPEFKPSAKPKAAAPVQEEEVVKQYTPKKSAPPAPTHVTTSIPRLDALLNEDVDEGSYNIDDILASLDRRG